MNGKMKDKGKGMIPGMEQDSSYDGDEKPMEEMGSMPTPEEMESAMLVMRRMCEHMKKMQSEE